MLIQNARPRCANLCSRVAQLFKPFAVLTIRIADGISTRNQWGIYGDAVNGSHFATVCAPATRVTGLRISNESTVPTPSHTIQLKQYSHS